MPALVEEEEELGVMCAERRHMNVVDVESGGGQRTHEERRGKRRV